MEKIQSGNVFIYKDAASRELQEKVTPTNEVSVLGTIGEFNQEVFASLLQIAPALYGEVFGLTRSGLKVVTEKFDIGGNGGFAEAIVRDDDLFMKIANQLIEKGIIRQEMEQEAVYFPTKDYLKRCGLVEA
jgi:hypothetical protein